MPKIINHEHRRRQVAQTVIAVIAEEGVGGATVRRIAESSGWSTGVLAHYFENKDALLAFALDHLVEVTTQRVELSSQEDGEAGLLGMLAAGLPLDAERLLEARAWFAFLGPALVNHPLAERMRNLHRAYRLLVAERIAHCQDQGLLDRTLTPDALAATLLAAVDGISAHAVFDWEDWPPAAQLDAVRRVIGSSAAPGFRAAANDA